MTSLTVAGIAQRWQVSTAQVYSLIHEGRLRSFKIGKSRGYRVALLEVERWESGESNEDTAETASASNGELKRPLPAGAIKALNGAA